MCVCQNEKRVPDKWQARQVKIANRNEKKSTQQACVCVCVCVCACVHVRACAYVCVILPKKSPQWLFSSGLQPT